MSFGSWLAERRAPRIALIAGLFMLPLVFLVSAAIVSLISQLRGWRQAFTDCLLALAVVIGITLLAGDNWLVFAVSAAGLWSAAIVLGGLAGRYRSLTLPMQAAVAAGMVGIGIFFIVVNDTEGFWQQFLKDEIKQLAALGLTVDRPEVLLDQARIMTGSLAGSVVLFSLLALLLGSWWAGKAGGRPVRDMFIQIRLGYVIGGAAALSGVIALLGATGLAGNLLLVAAVGFMFQGLAVIYWHGTVRKWPGPWPFLVYLPLGLGPQLAVAWIFILVALGFTDNWYGLRRRGMDVV